MTTRAPHLARAIGARHLGRAARAQHPVRAAWAGRLARTLCVAALATTTAWSGTGAAVAAPLAPAVATTADDAAASGTTSSGTTASGSVLCTGSIERQQVYADVRVPAGATCQIYYVGIHGDLRVDRGGTVRVVASAVEGEVLNAGEATFFRATVRERVWLDDAYGVRFIAASVEGSVLGKAGGYELYEARIAGSLNVTATGGATLQRSRVGGWLNVPSTRAARVTLSEVVADRGLTIKDADVVSLCWVDVGEHLVLRGVNRTAIGYPNSDGARCQGRSPSYGPDNYRVTVAGSARFEGDGTIQLRRLDVAEYLVCLDNDEITLDPGLGPDEPLVTAGLGRRGQCA